MSEDCTYATPRSTPSSRRSTPLSRQDRSSREMYGSVALIARVVATTNRPAVELFAVRPTVTLYRIHVRQFASSTRSWCVLRRYSEFVDLSNALARTVGTLPVLPPKLVINTPEALSERYLELDGFLRSLLTLPLAAGHAHVRSFLGADAAWAPIAGAVGGIDGAGIVEDDWEHEAEAGAGGDVGPLPSSSAGASASTSMGAALSSSPEPCWLLSGSWVADEARCRDGIEPLLRAMNTPQAVRRMLHGDRVVSRITHTPGVKLVEVTLSALGEGKPATYDLDGQPRPMWMGAKEAAVRAVELRRTGAVRLEYTLPEAKGQIFDTRRVISGGEEMERIIELHMTAEPPLRLHRLLVRTGQQPPPTMRPRVASLLDAAAEGAADSARLIDGLAEPARRHPHLSGGHMANCLNGHAGASVSARRPLARALGAVCVAPGRLALHLLEAAAVAPTASLGVLAMLMAHAAWLLLLSQAQLVGGDAGAPLRALTLALLWRQLGDAGSASCAHAPEGATADVHGGHAGAAALADATRADAAMASESGAPIKAVVWEARAAHVLLAIDLLAAWLLVMRPLAARRRASSKAAASDATEIASVPACGVASVARIPAASNPEATRTQASPPSIPAQSRPAATSPEPLEVMG